MTAEILSFETGRPAELAEGEPSLVVDVEGFEGPLDLLLALARQQKVDLAKISILALADQYLHFIEAARKDPAGACRRLSGDGGLARLPEIAAAAAGAAGRRRSERRGNGDRARQPAAPAGGDPRGRQPPDEPAAVAARGVPARQSRSRSPISAIPITRRPCTICSPPMPRSASSACWPRCISPSARCGRWREARASLERLIGHCRGLELPRRISARLCRRSLAEGDRVCVELCRRARTGARRPDGAESEAGVRAALFPQARAATGSTRAPICRPE